MDIKILGYDCPNCDKLHQRTVRAVEQLSLEANVEKVSNPQDVWSYGIVTPPTLVVDGQIVSQGKMFTIVQLKKLLKDIRESASSFAEGEL